MVLGDAASTMVTWTTPIDMREVAQPAASLPFNHSAIIYFSEHILILRSYFVYYDMGVLNTGRADSKIPSNSHT
jgi:hypothetical protein